MKKVKDIQQYVIYLTLLGEKSFFAYKINTNGGLYEFITAIEDIIYKTNGNIYCVSKNDYLDISNLSNITPIKKRDFEALYKKSSLQRHMQIDDIDF